MGCYKADVPDPNKSYAAGTRTQLRYAPFLAGAQAAIAPITGSAYSSTLEGALLGSSGGPQQITYTMPGGGRNVKTRTVNISTPGSRGLLDIYEKDIMPSMSRSQAAANTAQRTADIGDVMALAPQAWQAYRLGNPGGAGLLDTLTSQASTDLGLGASLNPSESRTIQQALRAGQSARGMGFGPADNFQEALTSLNYGRGLQDQRRGFAGGVLGATQSFYGDPMAAILGRPGQASGLGQNLLGQSGAAAGGSPNIAGGAADIAGADYNAHSAANIGEANANLAMTTNAASNAASY